jgi:hypothetical protein
MDPENEIPPPLPLQREELPLFAKRGEGRFSEEHVFSIMDPLVTQSIVGSWRSASMSPQASIGNRARRRANHDEKHELPGHRVGRALLG